jgi:imidazolonepropionase-like amidohydrolase
VRVVVEAAHAAGLPVTAHAHGLPAVYMVLAAGVDGIEHCSFLTGKGPSQSEQDLVRLAEVYPTPGWPDLWCRRRTRRPCSPSSG